MTEIAEWAWNEKYRLKRPDGAIVDQTIEDTWRRVATALAQPEAPNDRAYCSELFFREMNELRFLPAGRIIAGAGTGRDVTLMNCYVMGTIPDSMDGIMDALKDAAITQKAGGGVGMDFSTIRPEGALVAGVESGASGPLSFMDLWHAMCGTVMSAGARRGAMMGVLRVDHPDIEKFIEAKHTAGRLTNFNVSVGITDDFMRAVKDDTDFALQFNSVVWRRVRARDLWQKILRSTYEYAEPGVVFIDRMNTSNPLGAVERIAATNPCGEQPLPPYGACCLGSLNLAKFVLNPFSAQAGIKGPDLRRSVELAIRMLDNVLDITRYPLPQQAEEARLKRRVGLGVTGLADALIMCGLHYGEQAARERVGTWMSIVRDAAEKATYQLGIEKGSFPLFDPETFNWWRGDRREARRNSHVLSIAPTGTISLLAGNVSSGIEPVFDWRYSRNVLLPDGSKKKLLVEDYAHAMAPEPGGTLEWVSATNLSPSAHLDMQAVCQEFVDSSISKTINCPADMPFKDFARVYDDAWELGLKGCTTYRPSGVRGAVLEKLDAPKEPAPVTPPAPTPVVAPREDVLSGRTYKLKPAGADHALYVTINDHAGAPFEIFFNTKDPTAQAWMTALSRMISGVFRKGGDVSFVVEELEATYDPKGGFWYEGRYVPSMAAAIGGVIKRHLAALADGHASDVAEKAAYTDARLKAEAMGILPPIRPTCPKCHAPTLVRAEGCEFCTQCGHTKCG